MARRRAKVAQRRRRIERRLRPLTWTAQPRPMYTARNIQYEPSDRVRGLGGGGTCLQDIEQRRQDEVYLAALGAQRIPDPTTAGDFCRRFDEATIEALQAAINGTRVRVWRTRPAGCWGGA